MKKIQHVCSLGFNCHASYFLKTNGLKKESYPFDWIMSNLIVVEQCLKDNFVNYLDKKLYISNSPDSKCGHKLYCHNMFAHHNPMTNDEHYSYFVRCVSRFRTLLASSESKLFIISIINGEHDIGININNDIKKKFVDFNTFLQTQTVNYTLLIIVNYPNKKANNFKLTTCGNLVLLELTTLSTNSGSQYLNATDNTYLNSLFKQMFIFV